MPANKFKAIVIGYICISAVCLIATSLFVRHIFKSEISLAYNAEKLLHDFSHNKAGISSDMLKDMADKYPSILNIALIGTDNKIILKVNDSVLPGESLKFKRIKKSMWRVKGSPNIIFIPFNKGGVGRWFNAIFNIKDADNSHHYYYSTHKRNRFKDTFNVLNNTKYYDCAVKTNKRGERLLIIFDWQPVKNSKIAFAFAIIIPTLIIMSGCLLIALWVYRDALKRRCAGVIWGLFTLFTNFFGLFTYLIYRNYNRICPDCAAIQSRNHLHCTFCGHKIAKTCNGCGRTINKKDKYCHVCGEGLE